MNTGPIRPFRASYGRRVLVAFAALALAGCGGSTPAPEPGQNRGFPPDLRGRRVILLPVQQVLGVAGDPDAELAFVLTDRGNEIDWVMADEVDAMLTRSPALQTRTRGLPVGVFLQAEVERVGDPLFGQLRRMAGLADAEAILIPVLASFEASEPLPGAIDPPTPRVRFTATIIEPRTGRVVWFGIEEGGDFPQGDPRGLASAVENLARTLLWYVGA